MISTRITPPRTTQTNRSVTPGGTPCTSTSSPHPSTTAGGTGSKSAEDQTWLEFVADETSLADTVEEKTIGGRQKVMLHHQVLVSFLRNTKAKVIVANTPATNEGVPGLTYIISSTSVDSSIIIQTPASESGSAKDVLLLELVQGLEMWQACGSRQRFERGREILPPLAEYDPSPLSGLGMPAKMAGGTLPTESDDGSLFSSLKRAGGRRLGGGQVKACWEEYMAGKAKNCVKVARGREMPRFF
ncbi:hypothetical protein IAR50_003486 [Cryptococcus sp. DSM 104548]